MDMKSRLNRQGPEVDKYEARRQANNQRLNGEIKRAAKAAKRRKWQDRKIKFLEGKNGKD